MFWSILNISKMYITCNTTEAWWICFTLNFIWKISRKRLRTKKEEDWIVSLIHSELLPNSCYEENDWYNIIFLFSEHIHLFHISRIFRRRPWPLVRANKIIHHTKIIKIKRGYLVTSYGCRWVVFHGFSCKLRIISNSNWDSGPSSNRLNWTKNEFELYFNLNSEYLKSRDQPM